VGWLPESDHEFQRSTFTLAAKSSAMIPKNILLLESSCKVPAGTNDDAMLLWH
jgi:hypothetical protein